MTGATREVYMRRHNRNEMHIAIRDLRTEGSGAIEDLCEISEHLGYRGSFQQLICNNGSAVSSLLNFLEDNPGCVEAIHDWISYNYSDELSEVEDSEESE